MTNENHYTIQVALDELVNYCITLQLGSFTCHSQS
jgi:hypothetical protein